MTDSPVRVAACQMDVRLGEVDANCAAVLARLDEAAGQGAELVAFPECCLTGYGFSSVDEVRAVAETVDGGHVTTIASRAASLGVFTAFGFVERVHERLFNSLLLVGPNGFRSLYRKLHLPTMGLDRFVSPGDRGFQVAHTPLGRIGLSICYDQSFPECARVLALDGAQLIVLATNWPQGASGYKLTGARALENHVFNMAVNRVGRDGASRFVGQSSIVGCDGEPICQAGDSEETTLYADLDLAAANRKRIVVRPGEHEIDRIGDRRAEWYGRLVRE